MRARSAAARTDWREGSVTSGLDMAMVAILCLEVFGDCWYSTCDRIEAAIALAGLAVVCFSVVFARRTERIQPAGRRERVPFCSHAPAFIGRK